MLHETLTLGLVYTVSQGKHAVNVVGRKLLPHPPPPHILLKSALAAAAENGIEITRSLINLAKIQNGLSKPLTMYIHLLSNAEKDSQFV